jgi:beta-galactosidase
MKRVLILPILLIFLSTAFAQRVTLSLDGNWEIDESISPSEKPKIFQHRVAVPGLVNSATPAFPQVDEFASFERINHDADRKTIPESERIREGRGISKQPRNYFWYRRTFLAPKRAAVAMIRINKSQFGTAIWLNGQLLGEHPHCFTSSTYDANAAIRWGEKNEIVVRIGAHPGVLPVSIACGQDGEKNRWTPGIYDSVSFIATNNPTIEWMQIAPKIKTQSALIQTRIKNRSTQSITFELNHLVRERLSRKIVGRSEPIKVELAAGEEKTLEHSVPIRAARLWSPEDPFLYIAEVRTAGDSLTSKFGMREFRFDRATGRAMLNGKPYYLRGSNIALHRFFEDPLCGNLPWNERWVRRLLVELPRKLNWNSFRFSIGTVPDRWLEIADEAGLLIQNEYFYWTKRPTDSVHMDFDPNDLIVQFRDWMRDNWNHPSLVIWDASNETIEPLFNEKILPAVRGLDLSNRPWENGWNPPMLPDDPIEEHLYEFNRFVRNFATVQEGMVTLNERGEREKRSFAKNGNPRILNEYGWIWVNRDGRPTQLTERWFEKVISPKATADERIEEQCYLLAGVTEFWRKTRIFAGVQHFVYLTSSDPKAYTADHFRDVRRLELHAPFQNYMQEAFQPLGVYLDFWQRNLTAGSQLKLPVTITNDESHPSSGTLELRVEDINGKLLTSAKHPFRVDALGQFQHHFEIAAPLHKGNYRIKAVAIPSRPTKGSTKRSTTSFRKLIVH